MQKIVTKRILLIKKYEWATIKVCDANKIKQIFVNYTFLQFVLLYYCNLYQLAET